MERAELAAEPRSVLGKQVRELRRQGRVPGVMYGHLFDPVSVQFDEKTLRRLLSQVGGSQLVNVVVAGQDEPEMALVRNVQRDPITGALLHVDLFHVMMTERLRTDIPLTLVGASPVIVAKEGILLQGISALEVECLPGDLVDAIAVNLSSLVRVDQSLHVRDLQIPPGIEVLTDLDEMVVHVVALEEETIEEPVAVTAEVEVIREAKKEVEEEE